MLVTAAAAWEARALMAPLRPPLRLPLPKRRCTVGAASDAVAADAGAAWVLTGRGAWGAAGRGGARGATGSGVATAVAPGDDAGRRRGTALAGERCTVGRTEPVAAVGAEGKPAGARCTAAPGVGAVAAAKAAGPAPGRGGGDARVGATAARGAAGSGGTAEDTGSGADGTESGATAPAVGAAAEVVVGAVGMAVVLKGGVEGVAVVAVVAVETDEVVVVVAVARWTGGGVRPSGAAVPGGVEPGPGSGAPSGARCGGCADAVAEAGDAGVRRAAPGVVDWRTGSTGPEEVGAPRPPRRGAAALRCTGCAEAGFLPVPGWESGTAGGCPAWAAVPGAVPWTGRWTGGDAGVAEGALAPPACAASTARCTGAWADDAGDAGDAGVGAVGPWGVVDVSEVRPGAGVAGPVGPVGVDPDRDGCAARLGDGEFAGPEAAARRWTGGCAPAGAAGPPGAAERLGPVEGPFAAGEGVEGEGAAEREAPV